MVLPQAMAWVQYWFHVLSLKFCGKSKKNCGDISQVSPAFCMYGRDKFQVWCQQIINIWPGWGIYWTLDLRGQMARKVFKITNKNIKYRINKHQISINNKYLTWMMFILKAGPQRSDGAENSQYCWDVLTSEALTCFNSNLDSNPMLEICNVLFLFRLSNNWDLNCLQNM